MKTAPDSVELPEALPSVEYLEFVPPNFKELAQIQTSRIWGILRFEPFWRQTSANFSAQTPKITSKVNVLKGFRRLSEAKYKNFRLRR